MLAKVNGIKLGYTDEGGGSPLVFLHGFPFCRGIWSPQVEAFKSRYRVIAPDLPGFGESEATPGPTTMEQLARDLLALLKHLDTGPVILAGHSMGGYVALAFAHAYPESVRELILVGTRAGADAPETVRARYAMVERIRQEGVSALVGPSVPGYLSAANKDVAMAAALRAGMEPLNAEGLMSALLGMAQRPDAGAWLSQIQARTLVMAGADDTIIPPSESEALTMAIPRAQMKLIPKAGHLVAFERPLAFNQALEEWLAWGGFGTSLEPPEGLTLRPPPVPAA
jgi:pimeloyl-ACP methyl ester carboxylesterase